VYRAQVAHSVEREAELDPKTGLYNAGVWRREAERELAHASRHAASVSVAMFDLDHFRDVNTAHGHLGGDVVLAAVAARIRDAVRHYDVVGRFGGEEFSVLMPNATGHEALGVADRVRRCVAQEPVTLPSGDSVSLTVSGGVSTADGSCGLDELLHQADSALYSAKNAGRNQIQAHHHRAPKGYLWTRLSAPSVSSLAGGATR
jgi:diguanylate cyclase (GGDEF)-like protein